MWEASVPNEVHLSAHDAWHNVHDIMTRHPWVTSWHSSFPEYVTNNLLLCACAVLPLSPSVQAVAHNIQCLWDLINTYVQCLKRRYGSGSEDESWYQVLLVLCTEAQINATFSDDISETECSNTPALIDWKLGRIWRNQVSHGAEVNRDSRWRRRKVICSF